MTRRFFLAQATVFAWGIREAQGAEVVIAFEAGPGMRPILGRTDFRAMRPEDRAALITFSDHSKVRQRFTDRPEELRKTVLRLSAQMGLGLHVPRRGEKPVHVFQALADACELFDGGSGGRRRLLVLVFGNEEAKPEGGLEDVSKTLEAKQIRLYGVAVRRCVADAVDPRTQTPPTVPGPMPPVPMNRAAPPLKTLKGVRRLAEASEGAAWTGEWDFADVLKRARK